MQNSLKSKLINQQLTFGGWLSTASPAVADAMASCRFDWIVVDLEHSPLDETNLANIFMAIENHDVSPLVRLPRADPFLARRSLDLGAAGAIIPTVESIEDFTDFAQHCIYPPAGCRGVGLSRANKWGSEFEDYFENFQPVLIPQIETRKGSDLALDIVSLEMVDGLFIGPYDLSADLGDPGNFESPEFKLTLTAIKEACANKQKVCGIHQVAPDQSALQAKIDKGYQFLAYGTDMIAMRHAFKNLREC